MYDSVFASGLPEGGDLYAGYINGIYPNLGAVQARFPGKTVVSISVDAAADEGDVLDVESGDASSQQAPAWVVMRRSSGAVPSVYCSESNWPAVQAAFVQANVAQPSYWIAAYPGPGPVLYPGSVAHQYVDAGDYDASVVADYWPGVDAVPPISQNPGGINMQCEDPDTGGTWVLHPSDGSIWAYPVEGSATPPYLGGFNIHPDWNVNCANIAGISTFGSPGDHGYVIFVQEANGYNGYAFTRNGQYAKPTP